MVWFKVDDGLPSSEAVMSIPRRYRAAAIGLWTLAGAWCAKELTDGRVPAFMLEELAGTKAIAEQLVRAGLWAPCDDETVTVQAPSDAGWRFVNWDAYQPTREQVISSRKAEADRKRKQRERVSHRDNDGTPAGLHAESHQASEDPVPSRPVPSRKDKTQESSHVPDREGYPQTDGRTMPVADVRKVKLAIQSHCGRLASDNQVYMVIGRIVERAKTTPKDWTRFVTSCIERDPFEWQQMIDEAGVA